MSMAPERGKRKRITRKADRKLTLLVNLGGAWHEKKYVVGYPFQLINFSLPASGPLKMHSGAAPDMHHEPSAPPQDITRHLIVKPQLSLRLCRFHV